MYGTRRYSQSAKNLPDVSSFVLRHVSVIRLFFSCSRGLRRYNVVQHFRKYESTSEQAFKTTRTCTRTIERYHYLPCSYQLSSTRNLPIIPSYESTFEGTFVLSYESTFVRDLYEYTYSTCTRTTRYSKVLFSPHG